MLVLTQYTRCSLLVKKCRFLESVKFETPKSKMADVFPLRRRFEFFSKFSRTHAWNSISNNLLQDTHSLFSHDKCDFFYIHETLKLSWTISLMENTRNKPRGEYTLFAVEIAKNGRRFFIKFFFELSRSINKLHLPSRLLDENTKLFTKRPYFSHSLMNYTGENT